MQELSGTSFLMTTCSDYSAVIRYSYYCCTMLIILTDWLMIYFLKRMNSVRSVLKNECGM